jgi:tellurium resistance protein TerD
MQAFEDSDDPATSTRRRPFTASRGQKVRGEGDLIAHIGRASALTHADDLQLDVSAFLVGTDNMVVEGDRTYCVFYNNHLSADRSTRFLEDASDGSEFIRTHLRDVEEAVQKIVFGVSIYDAEILHHTFGSIADARFWIEGQFVNRTGLSQIKSEDLSKLFPTSAAVIIGEVYRSGTAWDYLPLGGGHTYANLTEMGRAYGVRFDD